MLFKIRNKILLCQFNNDTVSIPIHGKKSIEEYIDGNVWDACLGILEDGKFVSGFGCEDIEYEGIENAEDIAWIDSFSEKLDNISGIVLEYVRDDWHTGDPYYSNIFLIESFRAETPGFSHGEEPGFCSKYFCSTIINCFLI